MRKFYYLSLVLISTLIISTSCNDSKQERRKINNSDTSAREDVPVQNNVSERIFYTGKIDGKYAVRMFLDFDGSNVTGKYYYESQKRLLDIYGTISEGEVQLKEYFRNKMTGQWAGSSSDPAYLSGEWTGTKNTFSFDLAMSDSIEFYNILNTKKPHKGTISDFNDVLSHFKKKNLPFKVNENQQDGNFDTLLVQQYFEPDFIFAEAFGFNDFTPHYYYETDFGYVLTMFYYYMPGAFGINNSMYNVYTFNKNGKQIDNQEVSCFCYDTNMGANDYYSTDFEAFFEQGKITIEEANTHATLFTEELREGEEEFHLVTNSTIAYSVSTTGEISQIGGD